MKYFKYLVSVNILPQGSITMNSNVKVTVTSRIYGFFSWIGQNMDGKLHNIVLHYFILYCVLCRIYCIKYTIYYSNVKTARLQFVITQTVLKSCGLPQTTCPVYANRKARSVSDQWTVLHRTADKSVHVIGLYSLVT